MSKNLYSYSAFGLAISSEIECPGLLPIDKPADVSIRYGTVPLTLTNADCGLRYQVTPEQVQFTVDKVAKYLVCRGAEIIIDPEPGTDDDSIRLFLLGNALGILLLQRKILVLHGNAIDVNGKAVIFLGESGSGKSTLAAAFYKKSYPQISDDICAVTFSEAGIPYLQPGYPWIQLWNDAAESIQLDHEHLHPVRPALEKYFLPLESAHCSNMRPIAAMYKLSSVNQNNLTLRTLAGTEKFTTLVNNTFRPQFLAGLSIKTDHFKKCSALGEKIPVASVIRPAVGFCVDELVQLIEQDMTSVGLKLQNLT